MNINPTGVLSGTQNLNKLIKIGAIGEEEDKKMQLGASAQQGGVQPASTSVPYITPAAETAKTRVDAQLLGQDVKATKVTAETPEEKFLEFARMSPEEKARAAVLSRLGYTEDDLAALSPEELEKIEAKIKEEIKNEMDQKLGLS